MSHTVKKTKPGRVRELGVEDVIPITDLIPASVNDQVYKPIDPSDTGIQALAKSIKKRGLLVPIVVTLDNVILSGHRRRVACEVAGLEHVLVRRESIHSTDPNFLELLVEHNEQRVKSVDEQFREAVVTANKADAYKALIDHRREAARRPSASATASGLNVRAVDAARRRSAISR